MSTERKPLLSDERIAEVMGKEFIEGFNDYKVACGSARAVRNIYEAHLDRRDALVQELVDALKLESDFGNALLNKENVHGAKAEVRTRAVMAKAKSEGFTATDTQGK